MKKIIAFTIFVCIVGFSYSQTNYPEHEIIQNLPTGISYQGGPGANNEIKQWTYPYGTKLSVIKWPNRSFEIATTAYPNGDMVFRQWDVTNNEWRPWRKILMENYNGGLTNLTLNNTGDGAVLLDLQTERNWQFRQFSSGADTALELKSIGGGGNKNFLINTDGRVGIGTTSPSSTLDVDGNIHMKGGLLQFYRLYENYGNVMVFRTKDNNQYGDFRFEAERTDDASLRKLMFLDGGRGGLGIGTEEIPNGYKLAVDGKAILEEVNVRLSENWPDFVFNTNYILPTLEEVETHIKENGHLKDIPSEAEVKANGINLGEMDAKLLQKIEELTLYTIEQQKHIETQAAKNAKQQQFMEAQQKQLQLLKQQVNELNNKLNNN